MVDIEKQFGRFKLDNDRKLEQALAAFGGIALIAVIAFVIDRITDWTCDWWSQTCRDVSQMLLTIYLGIFIFIAYHAYQVYSQRGQIAASMAGFELAKQVVKVGGEHFEKLKEGFKDPQKLKEMALDFVDQAKAALEKFSQPAVPTSPKKKQNIEMAQQEKSVQSEQKQSTRSGSVASQQ